MNGEGFGKKKIQESIFITAGILEDKESMLIELGLKFVKERAETVLIIGEAKGRSMAMEGDFKIRFGIIR